LYIYEPKVTEKNYKNEDIDYTILGVTLYWKVKSSPYVSCPNGINIASWALLMFRKNVLR
jgi:hypothetical protein